MATVLERFNGLGLTHTKQIRSFAGERVSEAFKHDHPGDIPDRIEQTEGEYTFIVNDYPRYFQERMDYVIILACAELYKKTNEK
jgi:hypothetical protein